ncbi:hypothetical protein COLO4_11130 [Corchorus olitorius]|uniref:LOB domain-containing protein n=1 Tax=Corchorus olitorius TaxID=93759 RepID=A0A1R3K5R4_9ROSI|nr:hypothetical protein COLO4_11130 [Corchorus olitorius]
MGGSGSSPCASCKLLRRRCAKDCIFAPYFPSDDPHKFAIVHKVFGASNVSKMLQELPVQQRADAVSSLVYEANARMQQESSSSTAGALPTQFLDQDIDKSFLLAAATANNFDNISSQYLNFGSSSNVNVIQDPALKRESLWT